MNSRRKTPFELLRGRKPDLSHLQEIGARAFVLHPGDARKMEPRSEECILIGYGRNSKTYRCYHRRTHRVVESFHVKFIERKDADESNLKPGVVVTSSTLPAIDQAPSTSVDNSSTATPPHPLLQTPTNRTTIEEVPDVDVPAAKVEQKLRRSARVAARNTETTPVPDALASFVDALNSAALDSVGSVDLNR